MMIRSSLGPSLIIDRFRDHLAFFVCQTFPLRSSGNQPNTGTRLPTRVHNATRKTLYALGPQLCLSLIC